MRHDSNYASVVVDSSTSGSVFTSMQADEIEDFQPPILRLAERGKVLGNFMYLSESALLFDEKTNEVLGDFIEAAGQIFTLSVEGVGVRYLLNVLETCNPVDKRNSEVAQSDWHETLTNKTLKFHRDRVFSYSSLFKIPELRYLPILTFNGNTDHEHDFYAAYKDHELTGLAFDEIWSAEQ